MFSFFYDLKGQVTVLNALALLLILAFVFKRYQRGKTAALLVMISMLVFLVCSTSWLPNYLAYKLERKYIPFNPPFNSTDSDKVLIHVLGSGYALNNKLPPTAQLGPVALGRLVEGIRIQRMVKNSVIICSGFSPLGLESQAEITKRAAIVLGVEAINLETLIAPATTQQEAEELGKRYVKTSRLIIVTDAIHMKRAIKLFKAEGFDPTPAPTNFKVNKGPDQDRMKWWPSFKNIDLMNYVIHENLGTLKATIFK